MNILTVDNITKSYGVRKIFDGASFFLQEGEKAGIIGINGTGKSTLLKMIAGLEEADDGTVIKANHCLVRYLPQNPEFAPEETVLEAVLRGNRVEENAGTIEADAKSMLTKLGVTEFDQPCGQLSGGQRKRLALVSVLLSPAEILLLDEPTNHLDITSKEILEEALSNYEGTVLYVSHDRYFLNKVVTKVLEIELGELRTYMGNYSDYAAKKQQLRDIRLKEYLNQQQEIKHQEAVIEKLRSFNREKSIKRAESREKMLEKMQTIEKPIEVNTDIHLKLEPSCVSGNDVLTIEHLSKSFPGQELFTDVNLEIKRGEHVAVIGDNGTGKTTLLKILNRVVSADSGTYTLGSNVKIGYYDQEHHVLHMEKTIFDEISDDYPTLTNTEIRNVLAAFLFTGDDVFKQISSLSGGERGRVSLAKLMLSEANFLILDEPTNDLDIVTLGVLEEYLQAFKGCVIVVSHDRYFVDKVADHLLVFCGGGEIREFAGTYSDYTAWKRDYEAAKQAAVAQEKAKSTASGSRGGEIRKSGTAPAKTGAARKLTFQEKREMEHLEAEIPELEQKKAAIEEKLSSGDLPFEELTALSERITALMDQIDTKSMRWLELNEIGG